MNLSKTGTKTWVFLFRGEWDFFYSNLGVGPCCILVFLKNLLKRDRRVASSTSSRIDFVNRIEIFKPYVLIHEFQI
ncbi:hypothetical protein LEP1GSC041_4221 [Leptospira noguchii str. 2006001870]|nr:hypothetical protein LEP1GSC041_4221 [Leptospira noguchii str. 2006001870]